jgi:hypothetical protein
MWRVVIRDGRAVRVEPRITWPEDAEGDKLFIGGLPAS